MPRVILFASGGGSNVKAILTYFASKPHVEFPLIVSNNASAGVIQIAKSYNIPVMLINKDIFQDVSFSKMLKKYKPNLLVLAGFLWKIPSLLVNQFEGKIINIHPALLPKYGGKGMYGHYVHEAIVANHETETGITIHYVNEKYDDGAIILQEKIAIEPIDNALNVAQKVLALEHKYYARVIEKLLCSDFDLNLPESAEKIS